MPVSVQRPARILAIQLSLFLLLGSMPIISGCAVAVAGAAAGAGAIAYVRGELQSTLDKNYSRTVEATRTALADLEFAKISERKDAIDAELIYRTALDKKITVTLNKLTDNATKVRIRIDILGDEALSITILEKIKANL